MSINDLIEQGITIQGAVCVKRWNENKETYLILLECEEFELENRRNWFNKEILYMYVAGSKLNIEIK